MALGRLLRLQDAIRECSSGLAECSSPPPLGILGPVAAGDVRPLELMPIAKRSLDSHTKRVIILSTVLGSVGLVVLVVGVFLLWNNSRRQRVRAENAIADSLDVEYPSRSFYDSRAKQPTYEAYPPQPQKPSAYTPRRITNHPYASQYVEDVDIPDSALAPSTPAKETRTTAAAYPIRSPQPQTSPAVTVAIASSHPYRTPSPSDQEDSPRQRKPPTDNSNRNRPAPTSVVYESFMSVLDPSPPQTPEPGSPILSPVTSPGTSMTSDSLGRRKRQTTFSDITAETSNSVTSSTPLQPRPSLRQNRR